MKQLLLSLIISPMLFISCTNEEALNTSNQNEKMLESYAIKKNADGTYTLTHVVPQDVSTVYYDNDKLNEVELYFDGKAVNTTYSHNYNVVNNELNIKFSSENNVKQPKIKIIDDNSNQKGVYGLLEDYTISENADGSISLNFEVEAGVEVEYGYNENINSIKLVENSSAVQTTYTKLYNREADGTLKIDFIQSSSGKELEYKKPRLEFY